jgi:hypothetical protein
MCCLRQQEYGEDYYRMACCVRTIDWSLLRELVDSPWYYAITMSVNLKEFAECWNFGSYSTQSNTISAAALPESFGFQTLLFAPRASAFFCRCGCSEDDDFSSFRPSAHNLSTILSCKTHLRCNIYSTLPSPHIFNPFSPCPINSETIIPAYLPSPTSVSTGRSSGTFFLLFA